MTPTETALSIFLSDNGICCDTCSHYAKNRPISNTIDTVCGHAMNKQSNVGGSQYFNPRNSSFMCEFWSEYASDELTS